MISKTRYIITIQSILEVVKFNLDFGILTHKIDNKF